MPDPFISKAQTDDYDELIHLWEESVRATHKFLSEKDIADYKLLIYDYYFDTQNLYYLKDEAKIQGFIGLNDDFIQMLFVRPDLIGQGIGKTLIDFAVEEHGAKTVDVNEQNVNAVGFYQKLGFHVVERSEMDAAGKPYPSS
ncbi:MAG: GNAT family N-acetyltransferase, partial [Pedobacter sp.]